MYKILTPNRQYKGTIRGVCFIKGEAVIEDKQRAIYFEETLGFTVEEVIEEKKSEKKAARSQKQGDK